MPQIDQIAAIYASQLFWLVLVFALIYFGIGRAMLPKIQRTVDDRSAKISGDLAAAEAARAAADAAEGAYLAKLNDSRGKAQAQAAAAKAQATLATEQRLKSADAQIAERTFHAERALADRRDAALGEIEGVAIEAAQEIVARITGKAVDHKSAAAAVADAMVRG
ncbi:F-type H+-transporting ATPase subunit b [Sphingomonas vulcanisoli]|uniref:ATP synthase subunit b n=1 Tax=Sphingomonas vulcanisoli TaxID=1658060 RepID=A0ABX0TNC2_9SPHN|nr:ATPase [Sphingomonas vulcanisoli]NIJ07027.1 F-type H+-transporting ATPase subunit b [Sphingomonas vulcanisoli]